MLDGLLLVDKKQGMTSHDVVDRFRRSTRIKKAGHTGTLDPMATGLLILCVGRTTRLQAYFTGMEKSYEGEIQFGWATDTYDSEGRSAGEATERSVADVDFSAVLGKFAGEIDQIPPAYSAKKIAGERAYDLARKGEAPKLEAKRVTVYDFRITEVRESVATFVVRCSAGTYVRSLAHDLGEAIGVPAHLKSLRRTAIGTFDVKDALSLDLLEGGNREGIFAAPHWIPMNRLQLPLGEVHIDPTQEKRLLQGQTIFVKPVGAEIHQNDHVSIVNLESELVAIGVAVNVLREGGGPVAIQPKVVLKGS
jgi:tRNA pseudouridine55 synthase